jgi:hypothetical protein
MYTVEIDTGNSDFEYEVECINYYAGSPQTWDHPGDGWELDLRDNVKVKGFRGARSTITLEEFIEFYAEYHGLPLDRAEQKLREEVYEKVTQQLADDYDDREPDDG